LLELGLRYTDPITLVPPVTALIAHGVLRETMAPAARLGMALAALSIYLVMRRPR
jgi:drug/metabolite transporter (DMT)-like permease